ASRRMRIATIPIPSCVLSPRSRAPNASKRRKPGLRSRFAVSRSGDCRKALVDHGVVTAGSELANQRGDGSGSAVDYDGVLLIRGELGDGRWIDAHTDPWSQGHRLREGECTALEVVPAERCCGRGHALEE